MFLNYTCMIFIFFNLRLHVFHMQFCCFASAAVTVVHRIILLFKKSISYFVNIMYKHIFINFGVISFINKEMVSFFNCTLIRLA